MPMLPNTLRRLPPHAGHSVRASSVNDCTTSRCSPQSLQRYSYVGMERSEMVSTRQGRVPGYRRELLAYSTAAAWQPDPVKVRKAVIPAAGLGTRFLPATKAQPKEMLPVVDKPAIQYVVEEAVRAGIDDILIITGRGKRSLEDHFDRNFELEYYLERHGKIHELAEIQALAELADIHYVRQ